MMVKKYYYDQKGYEMEPDDAEKGTSENKNTERTSKVRQNISETETIENLRADALPEDDFVCIVKANVAEVIYGEWNLNDVVYNILNALQNVSRVKYYGMSMLIDILRGTETKRILDNRLDKISEYGLYKEMSRETISSIVEWMISEKLILKTKAKYPVLHSTYEGLHYNEIITTSKLNKLKRYLEEDVAMCK